MWVVGMTKLLSLLQMLLSIKNLMLLNQITEKRFKNRVWVVLFIAIIGGLLNTKIHAFHIKYIQTDLNCRIVFQCPWKFTRDFMLFELNK